MRRLSEDEKAAFARLHDLLAGELPAVRSALMNVELDGRDVAAVVEVVDGDDGAVGIRPVAVLVDDALFARLDPGPTDGPEAEGRGLLPEKEG